MKKFTRFAEITKSEELDDGTLKVYGYASSAAVDGDGETITADCMKAALPDYLKWGAVREMHQAKAAGTAILAEVQEDGRTYFGCHVVDGEAVKKVKAGVYKGFSIGGRVTERDGMTIKGMKLTEVSLVDRPCNPEAEITLFKMDGVEGDDAADTLEKSKGIYTLRNLANMVSDGNWIVQDAEWDGVSDEMKEKMKQWLNDGAAMLAPVAAEVAANIAADPKTAPTEAAPVTAVTVTTTNPPDTVQQADTTLDITKGGKKYSADTKAAIAKAHGLAKDMCAHFESMGYDKDDEPEKAASADDLQKVANDIIAKLQGDLATVTAAADTLTKRVKELEAMPAAGKGVAMATVAKADDVTNPPKEVEPIRKADGTVLAAETAIKKALFGR